MKTAIILHGMPSFEEYFNPQSPAQSNKHWIPWIQRQLIINNILAQALELPEPYRPDYQKWSSVFEQFPFNEETMLIGHSCGGGFIIRWLSEHKVRVGKVALVAPWINPTSKRPMPGFFDFKLDEQLINRTQGVGLFFSKDDEQEILTTSEYLQKMLKDIQVKTFESKGHFTLKDMKTEEFPELRDWLLK